AGTDAPTVLATAGDDIVAAGADSLGGVTSTSRIFLVKRSTGSVRAFAAPITGNRGITGVAVQDGVLYATGAAFYDPDNLNTNYGIGAFSLDTAQPVAGFEAATDGTTGGVAALGNGRIVAVGTGTAGLKRFGVFRFDSQTDALDTTFNAQVPHATGD